MEYNTKINVKIIYTSRLKGDELRFTAVCAT